MSFLNKILDLTRLENKNIGINKITKNLEILLKLGIKLVKIKIKFEILIKSQIINFYLEDYIDKLEL